MTPSDRKLERGDVVQLGPNVSEAFHLTFMIVTEPKGWGAVGFVWPLPSSNGRAYMRVKTEDMEYVGHATWIPEDA